MAKVIQVETDVLRSTAGKIEGLAADYKAQSEALYQKTDEMAASWDADDNRAFTNQIAGFKDDLAKMHALMLSYADFLRKSAKAYDDTVLGNVTMAKKLKH